MKIFKGVIVPMVTPVHSDYSIDEGAVEKIVTSFVADDCVPFVLSTTGEAASLSFRQKLTIVKKTVEVTNSRITVFAGISSTSLLEAIESAKVFFQHGVQVMVATLPYYYPISPSEMMRYFEQLADSVEAPLILYNMPATVGVSIPLDIARELSQHPNIVGMKDSEENIIRMEQCIDQWKDCDNFVYYLGRADQSAKALLKGADGIVPSLGNIFPGYYHQLYKAALNGKREEVFRLQELTDRITLIYLENKQLNRALPVLKVLMSAQGLCEPHTLPPMCDIAPDEQSRLIKQFRNLMASL